MGFKFSIDPDASCKNKGLRQGAKICLNSLWGKFGQRTTLHSYEYIDDWNQMLRMMNSEDVGASSWRIISPHFV